MHLNIRVFTVVCEHASQVEEGRRKKGGREKGGREKKASKRRRPRKREGQRRWEEGGEKGWRRGRWVV